MINLCSMLYIIYFNIIIGVILLELHILSWVTLEVFCLLVHIIALTATATIETLKVVSNCLSLESPVLVGCPPDRKNIFYNVQAMPIVLMSFANKFHQRSKIWD